MNQQDSGRAPIPATGSPLPTRERKASAVVIVVVLLALIIGGAYYWKAQRDVSSVPSGSGTASTAATAGTQAPVTFTTAVVGKTCTENVCANSAQCIQLSGTVNAGGTCALDQKQATPEAQGLLNILVPAAANQ